MEGTCSCIVGLGNQLVIVFAVNLKNGRVLGVYASINSWKSGQECSENCRNSGVMHGDDVCFTSGSRGSILRSQKRRVEFAAGFID